MSEFPWERAEASKQLGEKVTLRLASLPGGLARCPLPTHPGSPIWAWAPAWAPLCIAVCDRDEA